MDKSARKQERSSSPPIPQADLAQSVVRRFVEVDPQPERPQLATWKAVAITAWALFVVIAWGLAMLEMS